LDKNEAQHDLIIRHKEVAEQNGENDKKLSWEGQNNFTLATRIHLITHNCIPLSKLEGNVKY